MLMPLAATPSPALFVLLGSLLMVALGLLAMLLPQARLRRMLRVSDPAGVGMGAFALGLAASGLMLLALAALGGLHGPGTTDAPLSTCLVAGSGAVLLIAATDLLRTVLGLRRTLAATGR